MLCSEVVVDCTTFAEALEEIPPRRMRTCGLESFYALDVFEGKVSIQRWIKISRILFVSKGHKEADEATLALGAKYVNLLLLYPRHRDEVQQLQIFPIEFNGRCISPLQCSEDLHRLSRSSPEACMPLQTLRGTSCLPACDNIRDHRP